VRGRIILGSELLLYGVLKKFVPKLAIWHTNLAQMGDVPSACNPLTSRNYALLSQRKEHTLRSWVKVALVTALFAVPAMALGQVIWPPAPGSPEPTAGQLPFFLFLAVFEALTFGLGISFLLFGFVPLRRALGGSSWRTWAAYLAIGWLLVSWWPHDNMHIHNGSDMQGLLYIEYGFHLTLMVAGLVLAYTLLTMLRPGDAGVQARGAATARVR
jgi:hypothetical protein